MRIYIAARFDRLSEMNVYAQQLRGKGHVVDCRWLTGSHQLHPGAEQLDSSAGFIEDTNGVTMLGQPFAIDDLYDLENSDAIILFSEKPDVKTKRGGRHTEFGIAIGIGLKLYIVGPRENVFHTLPDIVRFNTWDDCMEYFSKTL